jgi:hypothetical protein
MIRYAPSDPSGFFTGKPIQAKKMKDFFLNKQKTMLLKFAKMKRN